MSRRRLFNEGWEFGKTEFGGNVTEWGSVCIPHDWLICDSHNMYEDSEGWYRKKFLYRPDFYLGRTYIRFDGVYMDSSVWLNGHHVYDWKNGYSTFEIDLTDYLVEGDNEILIKVRHRSPNSRWYSGAGIYRNVWLVSRPQTHIAGDGIYVSTVCDEGVWHVLADVEIENNESCISEIEFIISDTDGHKVAYKSLPNNKCAKISADIKADNVKLWSHNEVNLYSITVNLLAAGSVVIT